MTNTTPRHTMGRVRIDLAAVGKDAAESRACAANPHRDADGLGARCRRCISLWRRCNYPRSRITPTFRRSWHYIERAEPKKVFLNHGWRDFVWRLRRMGIDAEYLEQHQQLALF